MAWLDFLLGRPLASGEEKSERLGTLSGVPIFGLDALGSAAYGPEAALTLLIPLGIGGIHYIVPIMIVIIALLGIVYFSYRQTIAAYPQGGSSYVVARQNLGNFAGLLAGTALMVDFVLVVAVGVAAGIGALASAIPSLQTHTLFLCGSRSDHFRQPAGDQNDRSRVHVPDVFVHCMFGHGAWHWPIANVIQLGTSDRDHSAAEAPHGCRTDGWRMAHFEVVCKRLHCHDRG